MKRFYFTNEEAENIMKFQYSRTVANGDLYFCPCCGAEIFVQSEESPFITYCDKCGAEFDNDKTEK